MDAKKAVLSRSLFRDFIGLSVVVDFVMVGSVTCMPAHRVFRHTWRDNTEVRKVGGVGDSLAWATRLPPTLGIVPRCETCPHCGLNCIH
jgi:hypothetical protein